jgi:dipeptidyl aminopeptidase/acylaminoacyl peptidase
MAWPMNRTRPPWRNAVGLQRAWRALGVALLGACTGAVLAQPPAQAPMPASVFFQNPKFGDAEFSPDGTRVAVLVAGQGQHLQLAVLDLRTMKVNAALTRGVNRFAWVNDKRLIAWTAGLAAVNHDGTDFRWLVGGQRGAHQERGTLAWDSTVVHINSARRSDDIWAITPRQNNQRQGVGLFELRRMNTATRFIEQQDSPIHARQWFFDKDDTLRAVLTHDAEHGAFELVRPDGSWRKLYTFNARDPARTEPAPVFWAPDDSIYALAPAFGDKAAVYRFDVTTGALANPPLLSSKDFDLDPSFVVSDGRVVGLRYLVDAEVTHWLDPQLKAHQATIDELLPATTNRVSVALRPTLPYLLVKAYSDTQPELTYLFHTPTGKLSLLGSAFPDIKPAAMGLMDLVRYKARDGLEIPAWLTLPRGTEKLEKKNLPMVLMVHGGPWLRGHAWGWEASAQFLASRGYAVLQPEFRGSKGYGARHFKAGWHQWGLDMQADLADAVRWAVAKGIADPRRVAIMGGSYGGYAAMMGLVTDPDLYRGAINYVGVTDIDLMFTVSWSDVSDVGKQYSYAILIGDPATQAERFKATSPLRQAARIKKPVLMAYGEWDRRVPLIHGEKMLDALKPYNADVEWVVYDQEGHGWHEVSTRLDFWGRVERFLARNLAVTP